MQRTETTTSSSKRAGWTFAITSTALFMTALDNLVVTTALPTIRRHLHATIGGLEWTIAAYTLTFAALLLTGSSLGERFGRRRMFLVGLTIFTLGSAAAALSPGIGALVAARAMQGIGGAIVTPLTLTLLANAVAPERRALALGAWGAIGGLAVASGPLVGGAIVEWASWQWIFWLNVPIGLVLVPLAYARLEESRGKARRLDLPGVALGTSGLFGIVFGLVRSTSIGWSSPEVSGPLALGVVLIVLFALVELNAAEPMLPMRLFRNRAFTASNLASLLMSFGMFGSIFLLAQFLQIVQGYSPLRAGLSILPWTAMPMLIAPVAGIITQRIGGRPVLAVGLALQSLGLAWLAVVVSPTVPYSHLVPAFVLSGIGMSLFFAPMASTVLGAVSPGEEGIASGVNNAIREMGGVLGIAVLASVFSATGSYASGKAFVSGLVPATAAGAAIVGFAVVAALAIPRRGRRALEAGAPQPEMVLADLAGDDMAGTLVALG
jgi:EmrB/QacA subfamily drug resistance transporter